MKKLMILALFAAMPLTAAVADDGTDAYIELMRSDLRADKQAIVTVAMDLTDADSKVFWPIYKEYEAERVALADRILALIKMYPGAVEVTSQDTVTDLSVNWFKIQDDRTKLWRKYYKKIEKQIAPRVAIRWLQVEHRMSLLINLQLASEVPLIRPLAR